MKRSSWFIDELLGKNLTKATMLKLVWRGRLESMMEFVRQAGDLKKDLTVIWVRARGFCVGGDNCTVIFLKKQRKFE